MILNAKNPNLQQTYFPCVLPTTSWFYENILQLHGILGQKIVRNNSFSKMFLSYMVFFFMYTKTTYLVLVKRVKRPLLSPLLNPRVISSRKILELLKLRLRYPTSPLPSPPRSTRGKTFRGRVISQQEFFQCFIFHTHSNKEGGGGGSWSLTIDQFSHIECLRSFRKNALLTYSVCTHLLS